MKSVVTGGTGFIGSHLVRRLLDEGREVIVASDFLRLGIENLVGLGVGRADIAIRETDLRDYSQALNAVKGAQVVFHLAARVGSLEYLHGTEMAELAALQTNLLIDANLFRACLEGKVEKVIYASSCAVYPLEKQFSPGAIFSESDLDLSLLTQGTQPPQLATGSAAHPLPTIVPDGGYGWAKLLGEIQLSWMKGIEMGIARIFNVYGENEPLGEHAHVVADLLKKALRYPREKFVVYGDGSQSRDFLHVSDCVEALVKLEEKVSRPHESPLILNIGSGRATSVREIAEKIAWLTGKGMEPLYNPGKATGPVSRTANIERAKRLLGWEPKVSLEEGLRRTYLWAEERLR